jgi:hypothetical protein
MLLLRKLIMRQIYDRGWYRSMVDKSEASKEITAGIFRIKNY